MLHRPPPAPLPSRVLFGLVLWLLVALGYFVHGGDPVGNAHLALTRALSDGGRFDVTAESAATHRLIRRGERVFVDQPAGLALIARWVYGVVDDLPGGHAPFDSAIQLRAYALILLLGALPTALAAAAIASLLVREGVDRGWALALAAFYALGTPAFAGGARLCGAQLAGALGVIAFRMAMPIDRASDGSWTLRSGRGIVVGGLLGYATSVEPLALPLAMVIVSLLALRIDNPSGLVPLGLAFALALHPVVTYGIAAFGTPLALGLRVAPTVEGPTGLLALPRLLLFSPLLLMLVAVAIDHQGRLLRRDPPADWILGSWALLLIGAMVVGSDLDHQAAWAQGPPLALLFLPYAVLLLHPLSGEWRAVGLVLLALSILLSTAATAVDPLASPGELLAARGLSISTVPLDATGSAGPTAFSWGGRLGLPGLWPLALLLLWLGLGSGWLWKQRGLK